MVILLFVHEKLPSIGQIRGIPEKEEIEIENEVEIDENDNNFDTDYSESE